MLLLADTRSLVIDDGLQLHIEVMGKKFRVDSYCKITLAGLDHDAVVCPIVLAPDWVKFLMQQFGKNLRTITLRLSTYRKIPAGREESVMFFGDGLIGFQPTMLSCSLSEKAWASW